MSNSKDPLGDRMKMYESVESERKFMPLLPIVARLDGHSFSKFTKGMDFPVDERFRQAMNETVIHLVRETAAKIGYTQSDEITLVWYSDTLKCQSWFDGRILKTCTHLAAMASVFFNERISELMPEYAHRRPRFDARANNLPTLDEAANNILWRENDATKNSVLMLAQSYYTHSQLHGKSNNDLLDMLMEKGCNWNAMSPAFKRGVYVQSRTIRTPFTAAELAELPDKHHAHSNAYLTVARNVVGIVQMPIFSKISNPVEVVFEGDDPIVSGTENSF